MEIQIHQIKALEPEREEKWPLENKSSFVWLVMGRKKKEEKKKKMATAGFDSKTVSPAEHF